MADGASRDREGVRPGPWEAEATANGPSEREGAVADAGEALADAQVGHEPTRAIDVTGQVVPALDARSHIVPRTRLVPGLGSDSGPVRG